MSTGNFIIGRKNVINPDASGVVLINCENQIVDSSSNDTTNIQNGALIVDDEGVTKLVPSPKILTVIAGTYTVGTSEAIYFCDASAGNITITINHTRIPKTFIRTDSSANTVTLTPVSGLINGNANKSLTSNYDSFIVVSDLVNMYAIGSGGSSGPIDTGSDAVIDMGDRLIGSDFTDMGNRV